MGIVLIPIVLVLLGALGLAVAVRRSRPEGQVCPRCGSIRVRVVRRRFQQVASLNGNDHTFVEKRVRCRSCRRTSTIRVDDINHRGDRKYGSYD